MSIGRAFPVPDRPSRAATPPAKLGRACSWIHRCPRFALGVVDFSRLSEAASEKQRLEPPGAKWGGETRRARQLCASAALRVSSSPATVVRTVQQPERPARASAPAAVLGAWRPASPHPAAPRCDGAPGRAARRRSGAQLLNRAAESALGARTTSYGRRPIPRRCGRRSVTSSGDPGLTWATSGTPAG